MTLVTIRELIHRNKEIVYLKILVKASFLQKERFCQHLRKYHMVKFLGKVKPG